MIISIIAAMGKNRQIGLDGGLIWKIREDMKNFKSLTREHHVLMGRKTFQSIGRALPARENLVISRGKDPVPNGFYVFGSPPEAANFARNRGESELFIIGGAHIYEFFMARGLADRMYLTEVDYDGEADVFFPEFHEEDWETVEMRYFEKNDENEYGGRIRTILRKTETLASRM
ncbi:MAG: dihydrofolate reductase [Rickettsiales bacterium]|jgi:dihydrofolate reductase|nr:dihydrofolate reductase [Rickettsiales bacterium]